MFEAWKHLQTLPEVLNAIWGALEALVTEAIPLYEKFCSSQDYSEQFEKLERLFQINNNLLEAIGVSHPKLEQILRVAYKREFFTNVGVDRQASKLNTKAVAKLPLTLL
uniref:Uncharacterized protein n=1 Tax=Glossina austeni TaxID=7395 RepID=A0A1A9UWK2_GLOAU